jgi:sulfite exporter TauE/SafE
MHAETASAALLAGIGTGVHCALMCGPLACAVQARPATYHASRILSYTLAGTLCGSIGLGFRHLLETGPARIAPWFFLLALLAMATGLDRRIPLKSKLLSFIVTRRLSGALGWLSTFLPCGPLWLMFGAAAAASSPISGGTLLFAFGVGTTLLYVPVQAGVLRLKTFLSPQAIARTQAAVLWCASALLAWRIWNGGTHGCCEL